MVSGKPRDLYVHDLVITRDILCLGKNRMIFPNCDNNLLNPPLWCIMYIPTRYCGDGWVKVGRNLGIKAKDISFHMCALAIWVQCMHCLYLSIDGPGVKVLWGAGQPELLLRQLYVGCRRRRNWKSTLHSLQLPQLRLPHGGASVADFLVGASVACFLLLGASVACFLLFLAWKHSIFLFFCTS